MEIVGSVAPEEVPEGRRVFMQEGVWTRVHKQAIADAENGRVTVLKLKDQDELKKMKNNLSARLRAAGYSMHPVVVEQSDGLRVFLELRLRGPQNGAA